MRKSKQWFSELHVRRWNTFKEPTIPRLPQADVIYFGCVARAHNTKDSESRLCKLF